ncbi:hypothetical protein Cch01nite_40500 [Cellulomonas chitinilytica]|uniref:Uncharacterized protein n=1 Tax=Cellulomonas chitinilytica TaxID=398759 RepID=A0A919P836_9CELL|nr:hypothetical protein Cch01nite_40500 [Cellulomonas chitinilytica]
MALRCSLGSSCGTSGRSVASGKRAREAEARASIVESQAEAIVELNQHLRAGLVAELGVDGPTRTQVSQAVDELLPLGSLQALLRLSDRLRLVEDGTERIPPALPAPEGLSRDE